VPPDFRGCLASPRGRTPYERGDSGADRRAVESRGFLIQALVDGTRMQVVGTVASAPGHLPFVDIHPARDSHAKQVGGHRRGRPFDAVRGHPGHVQDHLYVDVCRKVQLRAHCVGPVAMRPAYPAGRRRAGIGR